MFFGNGFKIVPGYPKNAKNQGYQLIHRDLIHHTNQLRAMGARARHADGTRHTTPHQPATHSRTPRHSKSINRPTDSAVVAQLVQIRITV